MKFPHTRIVPCGTILLTLLASAAAESVPAEHPTPSPTLVTMATDNAASYRSVQVGLMELLLGWDEAARVHFRTAVTCDPQNSVGWAGLMLTDGATAETRHALEQILANENLSATPQEAALLSTMLQLVQGDSSGAGEEFAARAEQYRNDILSACWAVRLLHDAYDPIAGKPQPRQARALEWASRLYERRPSTHEALVCYLRGWVEQSAPRPSDTALEAARRACELMPEHPSTQLLYGHLLYRNGKLTEAIEHLELAARYACAAQANVPHGTISSAESLLNQPMAIRAKLYVATLLWLNNQTKASLLIQSELLQAAQLLTAEDALKPGAVLLHWEGRTLPLRLLMLSPQIPSDKQLAAAVKAATARSMWNNDLLPELRDCLRFCIATRQLSAAGKGTQALRCIRSAEACLKRLEAAQEGIAGQGGYQLSAWTRAVSACRQALFAARAAAYPDTSDVWLQSLEYERKPASLLMPPELPSSK